MLVTDIIRHKRDGGELTDGEIDFFVRGLADESIPAEQVSALAMAVFLNSMSARESGRLTMAMAGSGALLDWSAEHLDGPVVDKHSTGGVGDKVSFLLAPIAAACGCYVPMISGRGLGHTGGTTDKVESIPGYRSTPDFALFRKVVREAGCAIIGQSAELAPADRRFYAIRDITATVESVPLITASILCKKIAAGLEALVMDVKVGSGAFMRSLEQAMALAESIIATAASVGLRTHALVTDMNECLGTSAGNALEIRESIAFLADRHRDARLNEVVMALTAEMLVATGLEPDRKLARERTEQALVSGSAMAVFARMVSGLGGPADFVEHYDRYLPRAPVSMAVPPTRSGYLASVDGFRLGTAIIELGGGRRRLGESLDLAVGLTDVASIGEYVDGERPLAIIQARTEDAAATAASAVRQACRTQDDEPAERTIIYEYLDAE